MSFTVGGNIFRGDLGDNFLHFHNASCVAEVKEVFSLPDGDYDNLFVDMNPASGIAEVYAAKGPVDNDTLVTRLL